MKPKVALCNFFDDIKQLKVFALDNNFSGVDWSFNMEKLPSSPLEETRWVEHLSALNPLEVRFHCPFMRVDLGHEDSSKVLSALELFHRVIRLVSKTNGRFLTLHVGLGHDTTHILSWERTITNLRSLVQYGADRGVKVCLENLAWGWTSKPNLFEKLIRRTGAGMTFDIGHAQASESVSNQYFSPEDFVSPHPDRVYNAHIYHTEIPGVGHIPPDRIEDIKERLDILRKSVCLWWVIEIREAQKLLWTKQIIDDYIEETFAATVSDTSIKFRSEINQ
jgi:sugar phosphate isomerase/epimerase